jgi:hypothetical protein
VGKCGDARIKSVHLIPLPSRERATLSESEASGEGVHPSSGTMLNHRATFSRKGRRKNSGHLAREEVHEMFAKLERAMNAAFSPGSTGPCHEGGYR